MEDATRRVELHRKPLGVVAPIAPWNAPLYLSVNKIAPALIAGNTVVLKPPPTALLTLLRFGEIAAALLPAGVLNIVSGGAEAGARLVAHPDVAKIAFTGSTQTGRAIMAAAAPTLKRITLELGGNDAAIVLPDADPQAFAPALFGLAFFNSGQVCGDQAALRARELIRGGVHLGGQRKRGDLVQRAIRTPAPAGRSHGIEDICGHHACPLSSPRRRGSMHQKVAASSAARAWARKFVTEEPKVFLMSPAQRSGAKWVVKAH